ncbi:MAG TPA: hypothetical protein VFE50_06825 [Cyclobacteriaceae bacterium]|nr:hypothetical protein [Cyclobacteriaceae bacterium]
MRNVLKVSIALVALVIFVSAVGLLYPEIYRATSPNWLAQSVGQDGVDLFLIVPVLIFGTIYSFNSKRVAVYLWLGTLLYLVYTFLIYCFAVRFNALFLPYCLILGVSFFSFAWFFSGNKDRFYGSTRNKVLNVVGIYFIVISVAFYALWLFEVIPAAFNDEVPLSIREAGLFTNPVHVLDLSLFLPGTFMAGVLALRRTLLSTVLSPVLLTFFILMDLTIAALSIIMVLKDVGGSYTVAAVMICLAVFTLLLLVSYLRNDHHKANT